MAIYASWRALLQSMRPHQYTIFLSHLIQEMQVKNSLCNKRILESLLLPSAKYLVQAQLNVCDQCNSSCLSGMLNQFFPSSFSPSFSLKCKHYQRLNYSNTDRLVRFSQNKSCKCFCCICRDLELIWLLELQSNVNFQQSHELSRSMAAAALCSCIVMSGMTQFTQDEFDDYHSRKTGFYKTTLQNSNAGTIRWVKWRSNHTFLNQVPTRVSVNLGLWQMKTKCKFHSLCILLPDSFFWDECFRQRSAWPRKEFD